MIFNHAPQLDRGQLELPAPSLAELVPLTATSRSDLYHRFRAHFDLSISEYVIRRRMCAAQWMLYEVNVRIGADAPHEFLLRHREAVRYRRSEGICARTASSRSVVPCSVHQPPLSDWLRLGEVLHQTSGTAWS